MDSVGEVDDPVSMLGRPRFTGSRFATIDDHADAPIATPGGEAVVDQVADLHAASTQWCQPQSATWAHAKPVIVVGTL